MTTPKTKETISMTFCHGRMAYPVTIPAGTRCRLITKGGTAGRYWIDDLSWIPKEESFLRHDATHYGIDIPADMVE